MTARYIEIFELFTNAAMHLRYPAINFISKDGHKIRIYLATKGYIAIKVDGKYVGKLVRADAPILLYSAKELLPEIDTVLSSPISESALRGKEYGRCCFCNRELDNEGSIQHGYGPICAEKWGLPWSSERNWLDDL